MERGDSFYYRMKKQDISPQNGKGGQFVSQNGKSVGTVFVPEWNRRTVFVRECKRMAVL